MLANNNGNGFHMLCITVKDNMKCKEMGNLSP